MFKGRNDWYDMWDADKNSVLETMVRNMASDLDNGYNYFGDCIRKQREMIEQYREEYENQLMAFATMDEQSINKWCYFDMKRRGAID